MNTPWIVGTLAAIIFFAFFEAFAFKHRDRQNTLSRAIYTLGTKWPLSIWLMGAFCGGLAVHLFWHWCPVLEIGIG